MRYGLLLLASLVRAAGCKCPLLKRMSWTPTATNTVQPSPVLRRHYAHRFVSAELSPHRDPTP